MRFGFREGMEQYGDIAKDEKEAGRRAEDERQEKAIEEAEGEAVDLGQVLQWQTERRAKKTGTSVEAQREVFGVQKKKQEVMDRLKADIATLDDPEAEERAPESARGVVMRDGKLFCTLATGKEVEVTMGDLITDGVWGLEYKFDPETVPRLLRKRLLVERAKRDIEALLDDQILIEEIDSDRTHHFTREAYEAIRSRRDSGELPFGIVAERMVAQIARKMIIDQDQPYRYQNADVFQDVQQKIDFIIRRQDYGRGVKVEDGGDEIGAKGVQLTINMSSEAYTRKQEQIERSRSKLREDDRIDDIALMRVDNRILGGVYDQWKKTKPPGGPDKMLAAQFKERLFREMTAGMEKK